MGSTKRVLLLTASGLMALALNSNLPGGAPAAAQTAAEPMSKTCRVGPRSREIEIQKIEPFKMFDNLYHVGPCYVAVYLLTTPQGVIMFDTTQEPFVDKVIDNIKKVGVNPRDIKYIFINHGHLDHAGGSAKMQDLTGARVIAIAEDWTMIEAMEGKSNPNGRDTKPNHVAKRDFVAKEGDHIDLGDQHLIIHTAPGHTPGNMFVEGLVLHEGANTYKGIWGGGGGGEPGLAGARQGIINMNKVAAVKGVQVYLQTHSWQEPNGYPGGGIHERAKLIATRKAGDPNPFVDPATWDARVKRGVENAAKTLAAEEAKAAAK
jgi:metallo-beta-lactamase class B